MILIGTLRGVFFALLLIVSALIAGYATLHFRKYVRLGYYDDRVKTTLDFAVCKSLPERIGVLIRNNAENDIMEVSLWLEARRKGQTKELTVPQEMKHKIRIKPKGQSLLCWQAPTFSEPAGSFEELDWTIVSRYKYDWSE